MMNMNLVHTYSLIIHLDKRDQIHFWLVINSAKYFVGVEVVSLG